MRIRNAYFFANKTCIVNTYLYSLVMRTSPRRHALAVLRLTLGLGQKEMAQLVGCSAATIQSVELNSGRLKLSSSLAERISKETGVAVRWLLQNDTAAPIIDVAGEPFTAETFKRHRASRERPKTDFRDTAYVLRMATLAAWRITAAMVQAYEDDKFNLCDHAVFEACRNIESEFGSSATMGRQENGGIRNPKSFEEIEKWASNELERLRFKKANETKFVVLSRQKPSSDTEPLVNAQSRRNRTRKKGKK